MSEQLLVYAALYGALGAGYAVSGYASDVLEGPEDFEGIYFAKTILVGGLIGAAVGVATDPEGGFGELEAMLVMLIPIVDQFLNSTFGEKFIKGDSLRRS
jgi:hypothetical protein